MASLRQGECVSFPSLQHFTGGQGPPVSLKQDIMYAYNIKSGEIREKVEEADPV